MKRYKFYITLLDSFQRYLDGLMDVEEMLARINRVPFESEAAERGTAFNNLMDLYVTGKLSVPADQQAVKIEHKSRGGVQYLFEFPVSVISEISEILKNTAVQVYVSSSINCENGIVNLYGYMDNIGRYSGYDLKTTSRYDFPKYLNAWQHRGYLYCLNTSGINVELFQYVITNFYQVFTEIYPYMPSYKMQLKGICTQLIDFIEINRERITDMKIIEQ